MTAPYKPPAEADIIRRRRWAYGLIRRAAKPPPPYGSPAWFELPEGSPERIASVVIAAEAWAVDGENIAARLAGEVEWARKAFKVEEDVEYMERARAHRETAPRPATRARRAAAKLAAPPQPLDQVGGDYTGRHGA